MRFLIIAPKYVARFGEYYEFPLGLGYISSVLKEEDYHVDCLNLNHYDEPLESLMEREIIGKDIDVICTGGLSVHFNQVKAIMSAAREIKSDIITIVGGGLLSSEPSLMLEALRADFGVIGEGEETIAELAVAITNSKDFSSIKGIVYYDSNNNLITTPPRPPIENINSIPYPDYEGFEVDRYLDMQMPNDAYYMYLFDKPRILPIISSRSCLFNCTFCYHPLGKKYRERSLDDFFAEVKYLIERYSINMLAVLDELLSNDRQRIKEFCKRIKKFNLKWLCQMRVDSIDEEMIDMLKEAGCFTISYGLESASNTILKSMKKHIKLSQIEKALKLTYEAKIGIQGNFIFGDRAETQETANKTLQWWLRHREYQINLTPLITYPGSELYYNAINRGIIKDKLKFIEDECPTLNLTKMNSDEYKELFITINKYTQEYQMPAELISCKKEGVDLHKGAFYTIKVKCPHCYNIIKYKNIYLSGFKLYGHIFILSCRKCNQRFVLPNYESLQTRIEFILSRRRPGRLGIFGSGDHTKLLLKFTALSRENLACIFDNDISKHGMCINGVKIVPLNDKPEQVKSLVDAIVISSKAHENDIYRQISHLEKHGLKVYKLYDISNETILYHTASNYETLGEWEFAVEGFQEIIESSSNPDLIGRACYHLGRIYKELGNREKSTEYLRECLKFIPHHNKAKEILREINKENMLLSEV